MIRGKLESNNFFMERRKVISYGLLAILNGMNPDFGKQIGTEGIQQTAASSFNNKEVGRTGAMA